MSIFDDVSHPAEEITVEAELLVAIRGRRHKLTYEEAETLYEELSKFFERRS